MRSSSAILSQFDFKFTLAAEKLILLILCLALLITGTPAQADTIKLAVATNFTDAMKEIAKAFEHESGHQTQVSYASSGKLYAQLINGAPYDIFLSADTEKPKALVKKELALANSLMTYAEGKLVLWAPNMTLNHEKAKSVLSAGKYQHLAIANAKLAPYGMAAIEVLKNLNVYQVVKPKLVQGENLGQTYQFVQSGNAELGFIAYSQLIKTGQKGHADHWVVDSKLHHPIQQDAVLMKKAAQNAAAKAFMQYLTSNQAKSVMQSFGYQLPTR